jgi:two-component system response regulator
MEVVESNSQEKIQINSNSKTSGISEEYELYRKVFRNNPLPIMILDKDGYLVETNKAGFEALRGNFVGRKITEALKSPTSNLKLELIKKVVDEKEEVKITLHDKDRSKFYFVSLGPLEISNETFCLAIAEDISEEIRLNNLLNFVLDTHKILDNGDISKALRKMLLNFHMLKGIKLDFLIKTNNGFKPIINKDYIRDCTPIREIIATGKIHQVFDIKCVCENVSCPNYRSNVLVFPITHDRSIKGLMLFYFRGEFPVSRKEVEILKSISRLIGFLISRIELEEQKSKAYEQLVKNIENYAILIDHIRNPLAVISGIAELFVEDIEIKRSIMGEIKRIEDVIQKLDEGWLESEVIAKFLKRYI